MTALQLRSILIPLLLLSAYAMQAQTVIYSNDFRTGATAGWSTTLTNPSFQGAIGTVIPPNGGRFLGQFGNQTIRLDLPALPIHDSIRIEFDLYVIQTWDGNLTNESGPDIWSFGFAGELPLLRTTFNNNGFATQAYPDSFPGGVNRHQSGAASVNTLGYDNFGDAIYHFDIRRAHTASQTTLEFTAMLREATNMARLANESWGIDNITISTIDAPPVRPAATLEAASVSGAPGEIVEIPIRLRNARAIRESGATSFTGRLRFDASLLLPVDAQLNGTVSNGERSIPLSLPVTAGPDSILTTLRFQVALGSAVATDLLLEDFTATGGTVEIDTVAGRFMLVDYCQTGGVARLVSVGPSTLLKVSPNPAPGALRIDYSIAEDGPATLSLHDAAGARVAILLDAHALHGEYHTLLDPASLPAGSYLLTLRTASTVATTWVEVGR